MVRAANQNPAGGNNQSVLRKNSRNLQSVPGKIARRGGSKKSGLPIAGEDDRSGDRSLHRLEMVPARAGLRRYDSATAAAAHQRDQYGVDAGRGLPGVLHAGGFRDAR